MPLSIRYAAHARLETDDWPSLPDAFRGTRRSLVPNLRPPGTRSPGVRRLLRSPLPSLWNPARSRRRTLLRLSAWRRTGKTGSHIPPPGWKNPLAPQQPLASARWLLAAVLATLGFAVLCVYITICLLFWQGQWQLTFHPTSTITSTPASVGLKYDEVQFDATETGVLQLNGWWIPAGGQTPANTLLLLHGASGNLSDTVRQVQILHQLGLNVFVFDYRGFGKSRYLHPSEASTNQDADAAWSYLTDTRHLAPSTIAIDGIGLGAAIAAETARRHPQIPALILEDPQPPTLDSRAVEPSDPPPACPPAAARSLQSHPDAGRPAHA